MVAWQQPEALEAILEECERCRIEPRLIPDISTIFSKSSPHQPGAPNSQILPRATEDGRICVALRTSQRRFEEVRLGLRGRHQMTNATVAVSLAEALRERGFEISSDAVKCGIETATHPGRLEFWEGPPSILFDGAHNPAAARVLREYLDEFVTKPITMVFSAMQDKALSKLASTLFNAADTLILTELDNPRGASLESLKHAVPRNIDGAKVQSARSVDEAMLLAERVASPTGLICVTGSLYLVGAVQKVLRHQSSTSPH